MTPLTGLIELIDGIVCLFEIQHKFAGSPASTTRSMTSAQTGHNEFRPGFKFATVTVSPAAVSSDIAPSSVLRYRWLADPLSGHWGFEVCSHVFFWSKCLPYALSPHD